MILYFCVLAELSSTNSTPKAPHVNIIFVKNLDMDLLVLKGPFLRFLRGAARVFTRESHEGMIIISSQLQRR